MKVGDTALWLAGLCLLLLLYGVVAWARVHHPTGPFARRAAVPPAAAIPATADRELPVPAAGDTEP